MPIIFKLIMYDFSMILMIFLNLYAWECIVKTPQMVLKLKLWYFSVIGEVDVISFSFSDSASICACIYIYTQAHQHFIPYTLQT